MEDDDEFGDLYTDVLTTPFPPNSLDSGRPIDGKIDSDDEEILYGAPKSDSGIQRKALIESRAVDLNSELVGDTIGSEAETRVLERGKIVKLPEMIQGDDADINIVVDEGGNDGDYFVEKVGGVVAGEANSIPGVSKGVENEGGGANMEDDDWASEDSEDDLNIVLNDNSHHMQMGMERMQGVEYDQDDDDEDGEPLVILGDDGDAGPMKMEEHGWAGNEEGADGEKKEPGDAAKAGGGVAPMPKVGYAGSHHHHPLHSQFKYVRPGAAPLPGSVPGQVGRGDWRPTGVKSSASMHKGFHPGYGNPGWGGNTAGRGYGSGLDFTLPSHKTIFEVDIDIFDDKPWKLPGIDLSDFFNFDLNEESWKDYSKQLEQLRLETTMQNKIRVVGSVRAEQDYDPDLPPELAAAVGIQIIPSGNSQLRKAETDANGLAGASGQREPMPIGRPIPVDISSGERPPSIDTRRHRMHDVDVIIEIVCQGFTECQEQKDDSIPEDDRGVGKTGELQQDDAENLVEESVSRKEQLEKAGGNGNRERDFSPEVDGDVGTPVEERSGGGTVDSPERTAGSNKSEECVMDDQDVKQAAAVEVNGGSVDDRSVGVETEEMAIDATNRDKSTKRENHFSYRYRGYKKFPGDGDEDEVLLDGHNLHADDTKRPEEDDAIARRSHGREKGEDQRHHVVEKRKDTSYSRGSGNPHPPHRQYVESEPTDLRKEKDLSEERDGIDNTKRRNERVDDNRSKRLKENVQKSEYPEREGISRSHKVSSSRNKRAKDDGPDLLRMQRRDPEPSMKDDENHYLRQKDDRQRESDERYRPKLEDFSSRREREETKSRRSAEERSRSHYSRGKEDKRSNREQPSKDVGRRVDQLKRIDQPESESRQRDHERALARDERVEYGSGASRAHQRKKKEATRKKSDSGDPESMRKMDEQSNHVREAEAALSYAEHKSLTPDQLDIQMNSTGKAEPPNEERKQGEEDASSEDEQRKVRSKLERWASQKERDFNSSSTSSPSLTRISLGSRIPGEPNPNIEDKPLHPVGKKESDAAMSNDTKAVDENKQLDAAEKLKRRSERFKLPMPTGKESAANKKPEKEPLSLDRSEVHTDLDIKPERPPRKRRWKAN